MATVRYTVYNNFLLAEKRGGVRKAYRTDALGSTVSLYDNSQAKTDTFTYWPYGEDRVVSNPTGTKNRFVGGYQCRTQNDGGIYMRARVEEPRDGRFTTVDPLWPSEQAYAYAREAPVTMNDPFGTESIFDWLWRLFNPPDLIIPMPPPPFPLNEPKPVVIQGPLCSLRHLGMVDDFNYFTWTWGNCCGLSKKCGPGKSNGTCTDNACEKHDACVGPDVLPGAINWLKCAAAMCNNLKKCYTQNNCAAQITPSSECQADWEMGVFFCKQVGKTFPR